MKVLVAYGSKMGGTGGLAHSVADGLTEAGHDVVVRPADAVDGLGAWDAVVVGGALYASRWHRQARSFVGRHRDELGQMPVWFFSSGPLDYSASTANIPPTSQVRRLMELGKVRGHVTFGGRLDPHAKGFIARAMVKNGHAGDFRNMKAARDWGRLIATELTQLAPVVARARRERPTRGLRAVIATLTLYTGLTAVGGGLSLMLEPQGWADMDPTAMLSHSPFGDFFVPGFLLFTVIGLGNLVAGWMVLGHRRGSEVAALGAGVALAVFMATELAMIPGVHWLQLLYVVVALATLPSALALWLRRSRVSRTSDRSFAQKLRWRPTD